MLIIAKTLAKIKKNDMIRFVVGKYHFPDFPSFFNF